MNEPETGTEMTTFTSSINSLQDNSKINCYKNLLNYNAIQLWFIGECVNSGLIDNINIPIPNSINASNAKYELDNNQLQNGLGIDDEQMSPEYKKLIDFSIKELKNLISIINKYNEQSSSKVKITTNSNSDNGLVSTSTFVNIKVTFSAIPASKTRIRTIFSQIFGEDIITSSELDKTKDRIILFYLGRNLNNPNTAMTVAKGIFIDCNKTWKKLCAALPNRAFINKNIKKRCDDAKTNKEVINGRIPILSTSLGGKKSYKRRKGKKVRKTKKGKKIKKSRKVHKIKKARKSRK